MQVEEHNVQANCVLQPCRGKLGATLEMDSWLDFRNRDRRQICFRQFLIKSWKFSCFELAPFRNGSFDALARLAVEGYRL